MKKHFYLLKTCLCALAVGVLAGCSADEGDGLQIPEGSGIVELSVNTDTGFQTRAESEKTYEDLNNYTVQILQGTEVVDNHEYAYPDMPNFIELSNGSYTFKAFSGVDKAVYAGADTLNLYFSDEEPFTLRGDTAKVKLTCEPNSARINVVFDASMDKYFSDYKVNISTAAQDGSVYPWTKTTEGPIYFKVNNQEKVTFTVDLTPKTGKADPKVVTYELSPKDSKTINVSATSNAGSLGITIEIDKEVIEHPVEIEIPSDWVE